MKVVFTGSSRQEADIVVGLLESGGIKCHVETDDEGGLHPGMASVAGVKVLVDESDYKDAKAVLDADDA